MPVGSGPVRAVMQPSSKTLGLIAGSGTLPCIIATEARKRGFRVIVIALQPPADESLRPLADYFKKVHIGRFGEIIKTLKKSSVHEVVMAGKVPKTLLYQKKKSLIPDMRALKILLSLKDRSDSAFMDAISTEIENEGMKLTKATSFIEDMMTTEGVLTKKKPKQSQWNDIAYGWKIAKGIGSLDIGQTVVIKGTAVMAVEAIEGTDEAIIRGGNLAGHGAVVVKVFKPKQDARLDVPVVGCDTLSTMKQAGANVLALEAKKSIILDKEKFLREADEAGIVVVGVTADCMKD